MVCKEISVNVRAANVGVKWDSNGIVALALIGDRLTNLNTWRRH